VLLTIERERSDCQGLQVGTVLEVNLKMGALNRSPSLEAVTIRYHRSLVHLGSSSNGVGYHRSRGPVHLGSSFRDVSNLCRVLLSPKYPVEIDLRAGR